MEKAYFLFLAALVASLGTASSSTTNVVAHNNTSDHDLGALLAFRAAISDPQNILPVNWSTSTSVCNWIGITCNRRHRRVAAIQLPKLGLFGTIPPQLGNLSFLVWLDLENNSFHGNLPTQMVHLRRLKHINFAFNSFDGEFPSWLGALYRLRYLSFHSNRISGSLPTTLSNATMLETIRLGTNLMTGNLPQDWSALQNLEFLDMGNNKLEGPLPRSLFNLSSLQHFSFSNNTLSGYLPVRICHHLPQLQGLYLSYNEFSGAVPAGIGGCPRLQILSLSYNNLAGNIPREIWNLTALRNLYLGANDIQGQIPADIGNHTNLQQLGIQFANLTEAWALLIGLQTCKHRGFENISVQSDSLLLVGIIQRSTQCPWQIRREIRQIWKLLQEPIHFSHCYREANTVADALSNVGVSHPHQKVKVYDSFTMFPREARGAIRLDKLGLPSIRKIRRM
nr:LRR receptor-like serine/threonine-protein kinase EFR isoform X2 [Coffea arabica]